MNNNWTAISLALGFTLLSSLATFAQGTGGAMQDGDAMKGGGTKGSAILLGWDVQVQLWLAPFFPTINL